MRCQIKYGGAIGFFLVIASNCFGAIINGVVVDSERTPVPEARVHLVVDRKHYFIPDDVKPLAESVTDKDGRFTLDAPSSESLALLAWGKGLRRAKFPVNVEAMGSRTIGVALDRGEQIAGRVVDERGRPVADAVVGPLVPGIDTERAVGQKIIPEWTQTGADGKFSFDSVMPDVTYHFLTKSADKQMVDTTVQAGAKRVEVRLRPGGYTVPGELTAKSLPGSTFAGIPVRLNGNGFDDFVPADGNGAFKFEGVPAGSYSLEALLSYGWEARVVKVELPQDAGTSMAIEVSSGYFVTGMAVDAETSEPAAGVTIAANDVMTSSSGDGTFSAGPLWAAGPINLTIPDDTGWQPEFEIPAVSGDGFNDVRDVNVRVRRQRTIHVTIGNFEQSTGPVVLHVLTNRQPEQRERTTTNTADVRVFRRGKYAIYAESGDLVSPVEHFTIAGAVGPKVELTLGTAASVGGRVASNSAETTRPKTFRVRALSNEAGTSAVLIAETATARDAGFSFPVLPTGNFRFEAGNASLSRIQSHDVKLTPGANPAIEFSFAGGRSFTGVVKTSDGKPVPAVRLQYVLTLASGEKQGGFFQSDDSGHFAAEDLDAVAVAKLEIDHHGFAPYVQTEINLPAENYQIVLKPGGVVRAKVDASPDTNWRVSLLRADKWSRGAYAEQLMSTPAGDERNCSGGDVVDLIPPNDARFRIMASGPAGAVAISEPFTWKAADAKVTEVTLVPKANGSLSGTLLGSSGKIEVIATNTTLPPGNAQSEFKTETNGSAFELESLPPGDYMVQAGGEAYSATATNVEIRAGEKTRVTLSPESKAEVSGVVTLNGAAVRGARVEMVSETDSSAKQVETRTKDDGSFVVQDVAPDSYLVRVELEQGGKSIKGQKQVVVGREKAPEPVTIDLTPARTVTFQIPAEYNLPTGSDVSFANTETHELVKLRWNGNAAEAELPAGKYDVWKGDAPAAKAEVSASGSVTFTR